jgi:hypothetical protein
VPHSTHISGGTERWVPYTPPVCVGAARARDAARTGEVGGAAAYLIEIGTRRLAAIVGASDGLDELDPESGGGQRFSVTLSVFVVLFWAAS